MNAITYREIFPLIKDNKLWIGVTNFNVGMYFYVPDSFVYASTYKFEREMDGRKVNRVPGTCWYTNIDHGKRHSFLPLMTMADNLKYSRHKEIHENNYQKYDNYDAIEVPFADAIPSDYEGVMGVPISFLDKYCPEQFEIIALGNSRDNFTPTKDYVNPKKHMKNGAIVSGGAINCVLAIEQNEAPSGVVYYTSDNSKFLVPPYARILIKAKEIK